MDSSVSRSVFVESRVFNTEVLRPGVGINVHQIDAVLDAPVNFNCLIRDSKPLALIVVYVDPDKVPYGGHRYVEETLKIEVADRLRINILETPK